MSRQMKKEKKMFLEKLACGISRMKHDNNIEQLRGPKPVKISRVISRKITYDEMLPGSPESNDDLFSIELFPKSKQFKYHQPTSFHLIRQNYPITFYIYVLIDL